MFVCLVVFFWCEWMLWIFELTTSNFCSTFKMFMGLEWGDRDGYISGSKLQANIKCMDTSYALEWRTVLNPLWLLLFSLLFFLNLFSRGAALFYMFFKQQYAVNSHMRFQFAILKIITLLLNSKETAANLPNLPPHGPHPILPVSILTSSSHQYFCK